MSSGCFGSGGPADTTIDIVFDPCAPLVLDLPADNPAAKASTQDAIAMWNHVATLQVTLAPTSGAPIIPITFEDAAAAFRGIYLDESGEIVINQRITDRRALAVTIAHELGHAFGLAHIAAAKRPSVMNPGNSSQAPNPDDAAALARLWGGCARR